MKINFIILKIITIILCIITNIANADKWKRRAGDPYSIIVVLDKKDGHIKYKFQEKGYHYFLVDIKEKILLFESLEGDHSEDKDYLCAVDLITKEMKWKTKIDRYKGHIFSNNLVYVIERNNVKAINILSGKIKWIFTMKEEKLFHQIYDFDNLLGVEAGLTQTLYIIDKLNGKLKWKFSGIRTSWYGHIATKNSIYVFSSKNGLICLNISNGKIRWNKSRVEKIIFADNKSIFIITSETQYSYWVEALDSENGKTIWKFHIDVGNGYYSIFRNGRIYILSNNNKIYCLNYLNGKLIWEYKCHTYYGTIKHPIIKNNNLYVACRGGEIHIIDILNGERKHLIKSDKSYPRIIMDEDNIYISSSTNDKSISAFRLDNNKLKWKWECDISGLSIGKVALSENEIYVSLIYSNLLLK